MAVLGFNFPPDSGEKVILSFSPQQGALIFYDFVLNFLISVFFSVHSKVFVQVTLEITVLMSLTFFMNMVSHKQTNYPRPKQRL